MIAFEVHRNGEKLCVAGADGGILTAILTCQDHVSRAGVEGEPPTITFHIGGLNRSKSVTSETETWANEALKPGDEIRIRIIQTELIDASHESEADIPEPRLEALARQAALEVEAEMEQERRGRN